MCFEIKYKGQPYQTITDVVSKAIIDKTEEYFKEQLKPFQNEIKQHNGSVTINLPENLEKANIEFKNLPSELINRITKSLG